MRPSGKPGGSPYVAWDRGQRFLFTLDRLEPSRVVSLAIDQNTGGLRLINRVEIGPGSPPHLSVHKSGRWVLVAHYNSSDGGYASVLPIAPDGKLGAPQERIPVGLKTHMIITDPTGRFAFVPCTNSNYIAQYFLMPAAESFVPMILPPQPLPQVPARATWPFTLRSRWSTSSTRPPAPYFFCLQPGQRNTLGTPNSRHAPLHFRSKAEQHRSRAGLAIGQVCLWFESGSRQHRHLLGRSPDRETPPNRLGAGGR